jgi:hypothetical protein
MTQVYVHSTINFRPVHSSASCGRAVASDGNFSARLFCYATVHRRSRKRKPLHESERASASGYFVTRQMPPPTHQSQDGEDPVLIGMCHLVSSWQGRHRPMGPSGGETETCRGKRHPKPKPAIPDSCDCGSSIAVLGVCDCPTARSQPRPPAPCLPASFGRLATPTAVFSSNIQESREVQAFQKGYGCLLYA